MEYWEPIKDAEGYEISDLGRVRNSKTGRILKPDLDRPGGLERVNLHGKHRYIHKLMVENIYGHELKENEMIRHIDGKKRHNRPHNLKIVEKSVKISPANRG